MLPLQNGHGTEHVDKAGLYISAQKVEYSSKYKDNLCMCTLWSVT